MVEGFGSLERLRKGGKNTQKNYTKKSLNDPVNHDDVVTHLEPDILECLKLICSFGGADGETRGDR